MSTKDVRPLQSGNIWQLASGDKSMSFMDWYGSRVKSTNSRLDTVTPKGEQVGVDGDSIVVSSHGKTAQYPLADLTAANLFCNDGLLMSHTVLSMRFSDSFECQMTRDNPQWNDLAAALERSGKMARPLWQWEQELMADGSRPLDLLDSTH